MGKGKMKKNMVNIELDIYQHLADYINLIGEKSGLGGGAVATLLITMKTMTLQEELGSSSKEEVPPEITKTFVCPICADILDDDLDTLDQCTVNGIRTCPYCTVMVETVDTALELGLPIERIRKRTAEEKGE